MPVPIPPSPFSIRSGPYDGEPQELANYPLLVEIRKTAIKVGQPAIIFHPRHYHVMQHAFDRPWEVLAAQINAAGDGELGRVAYNIICYWEVVDSSQDGRG